MKKIYEKYQHVIAWYYRFPQNCPPFSVAAITRTTNVYNKNIILVPPFLVSAEYTKNIVCCGLLAIYNILTNLDQWFHYSIQIHRKTAYLKYGLFLKPPIVPTCKTMLIIRSKGVVLTNKCWLFKKKLIKQEHILFD